MLLDHNQSSNRKSSQQPTELFYTTQCTDYDYTGMSKMSKILCALSHVVVAYIGMLDNKWSVHFYKNIGFTQLQQVSDYLKRHHHDKF